MKKILIIILFLSAVIAAQSATGPLIVHPENPRYFSDKNGDVVYLTGAHNWNVLMDVEGGLEYIEYLNYLQDNDLNFLRLWGNMEWVWNRAGEYTEKVKYKVPTIYKRTGPGSATDGNPKFDLTEFNPEYTAKLKKIIEAAHERGIYVSIMLFEGWWNSDSSFRDDAWYGHPFNPLNNINRLSVSPPNIHSLDESKVVSLQEIYVKHVIDAVNGYDNIMYEIINEDKVGTNEWQIHIMNTIRAYERTKPKQHPVWITSKSWGTKDDWIWRSTAEAMSPTLLSYWNDPNEPYLVNPPVTDGSKVVIIDTDHFLGITNPVDWKRFIWKSFLRGYNPIIMDPYKYHESWALEPGIILAAKYTRRYAKKMDLAKMEPANSATLCSTTYCLRNPNTEYLVYQPSGRSFSVKLGAGSYYYEWFDPASVTVQESGIKAFSAGTNLFAVPASINSDSLLYLKYNSCDSSSAD